MATKEDYKKHAADDAAALNPSVRPTSTPWMPAHRRKTLSSAHGEVETVPDDSVTATASEASYRRLWKMMADRDASGVLAYAAGRRADESRSDSGTSPVSLCDAVQQLSCADVWGVLRLVMNQLTTAHISHNLQRSDFQLIHALYPIKERLDVQHRLLTYFVTFPLPSTGKASMMNFVSVFTDTLFALGADLEYVYFCLLAMALPTAATCGSVALELLVEMEPFLHWTSTPEDDAALQQSYASQNLLGWRRAGPQQSVLSISSSDVSRVAWLLLGELAGRGLQRAVLLLGVVARHPSLCPKASLVLTQYLHAVQLHHQSANSRVAWREYHHTMTSRGVGGGLRLAEDGGLAAATEAHRDGSLSIDVGDYTADLLCSLQALWQQDAKEVDGSDSALPEAWGTVTCLSEGEAREHATDLAGLVIHVESSHRLVLRDFLPSFLLRVWGLAPPSVSCSFPLSALSVLSLQAAEAAAPAAEEDSFHVHDYHLTLMLQKVGLTNSVIQTFLFTYVHRRPRSRLALSSMQWFTNAVAAQAPQLERLVF